MRVNHLHIIAFNTPYPANYGGVIDIFYKLKALSEQNVKIILHAFEYGREHSPKLTKYCEKVYYYPRKTGWRSQVSRLPYIVYSRKDKELLNNLLKNDYPILFEGLHTTYYLNNPLLENRLKIVRAHNIEHLYYKGLAENSHTSTSKLFFQIESLRLKNYENILNHADHILALSTIDNEYFKQKFGEQKVRLIPLFTENKSLIRNTIVKPYALFHGDLSTPENNKAASFLFSVAEKSHDIHWIFAGLNPSAELIKVASRYPNIEIRSNLAVDKMETLIREAAVNVLYTNQISGVKLKLLNALFKGNHCLATKEMTAGSGLDSLCTLISSDANEIITKIKAAFLQPINDDTLCKRETVLNQLYNNEANAKQIIDLL